MGAGEIEVYRSTGVVQSYSGTRVRQRYRDAVIVCGYRCTCIAQVCRGNVHLYNWYWSSTMVYKYRSRTLVIHGYEGSTVILD
jgi:hypothetical protein